MKRLIGYISFGIMLSTMLLFGMWNNVIAESNTGAHYVLGPTSQRLSLVPGERYRSSVYVSNPNSSSGDISVVLYVSPYGVTNDEYDPTFDQETNYTEIAKWITLDETELTISPNQKVDVGFTIDVPDDAPAGGQYAAIIVQGVVEDSQQSGGVNIKDVAAIGSIVVADIAGETRADGIVIDNAIPAFILSNPLRASSTVRNDGNVHTDAEYVLQVWPLFSGEEVCTNEENPETSLIMPETERYHAQTCNLPTIGIFRAKQTVKIFGETSIVEKMVIVCPLWLLFLIIFAIVALIIWLVTKSKARKRQTETE